MNPLNRRCFQREAWGRLSPHTAKITLLEKLLYTGLRRRRGNCKWCILWIIHEAVVNDNVIMAWLYTASRMEKWRWAHWRWFPLNYDLYNCYVNNNQQISPSNYLWLCLAECRMRKRFSHSYKSDSGSQARCDCKHWACGLIVTFNMGILSCLRLLLTVLSGGASCVILSWQDASCASDKSFLLQSAEKQKVQSKQESLMQESDIEVARRCAIYNC